MKAVDTHVLCRFFIDDPEDPQAARQRPAAVAALSGRVFVPVTVVLEFEWVMRGFYALPKREILRVLRALAGIEHVTLEDRKHVLLALEAFEGGLDLADALHLVRCSPCAEFVSFDRKLVRRAQALGLSPAAVLLTG